MELVYLSSSHDPMIKYFAPLTWFLNLILVGLDR